MKKKLSEKLDDIWHGFCYVLLVIFLIAIAIAVPPTAILLFLAIGALLNHKS